MRAISFTIHLLQPLILSKISAGEENSSETEDFIPGSAIRGALIQQYMNLFPKVDIAHDKESRNLFFEGGCKFLHGYIQDGGGERMLPKPLSLKVKKDEQNNPYAEISDLAIPGAILPDQAVSPLGNWTLIRKIDDSNDKEGVLYSPRKRSMVHNLSSVRMVKSARKSNVFRYDALAAGQSFSAVIIGSGIECLIETLDWETPVRVRLGRSKDSEYGLVEFSSPQIVENWCEYNKNLENSSNFFSVTLLSDAILIGEDGLQQDTPDQYFGAENVRAFKKTSVVSGYNRKWGLPLPQVISLQAGSVFTYPSYCFNSEKIQKVLEEGIGDRRIEGFGRVAINWQVEAKINQRPRFIWDQHKKESIKSPVAWNKLSDSSKSMLGWMGERLYQSEIESKLNGVLASYDIRNIKGNTQLSRIRSAVHRAGQEADLNPITDHLDGLKSAKDTIHNAKVINNLESQSKTVRLDDWIRDIVKNNEQWWRRWLEPENVPSELIPGENKQKFYRVKYTLLFLDAIFKKTVKANQADTKISLLSSGESQ